MQPWTTLYGTVYIPYALYIAIVHEVIASDRSISVQDGGGGGQFLSPPPSHDFLFVCLLAQRSVVYVNDDTPTRLLFCHKFFSGRGGGGMCCDLNKQAPYPSPDLMWPFSKVKDQ